MISVVLYGVTLTAGRFLRNAESASKFDEGTYTTVLTCIFRVTYRVFCILAEVRQTVKPLELHLHFKLYKVRLVLRAVELKFHLIRNPFFRQLEHWSTWNLANLIPHGLCGGPAEDAAKGKFSRFAFTCLRSRAEFLGRKCDVSWAFCGTFSSHGIGKRVNVSDQSTLLMEKRVSSGIFQRY